MDFTQHNQGVINEVLRIVNRKITKFGDTNVYDIELAIESITQEVLIMTNRDDLPMQLKFTIADMVYDYLTSQRVIDDGSGVPKEQPKAVASIKEGDVTIQFKGSDMTPGQKSVEDIMYNYKTKIRKFRKVPW